jgi:drug/metabolite transporter (DMT)-like permease
VALVGWGSGEDLGTGDSVFPLVLIAVAAGLWGIYSLAARALPGVPTAAMGVFFAATALIAGMAHFVLEPSVAPTGEQWVTVLALGMLPMGLALYLWDFGVKRGDLQALSAFSYFEPFAAALLVAALGQGAVGWNVAFGGILIVGGAVLASRSLWRPQLALPNPAAGDDRNGRPWPG